METFFVNIYSSNEKISIDKTKLPSVFFSPIRLDILKFVHSNMSKNKRQPYAVNQAAGMNTSAKSWGTGRAVSRVPRVPGGGTNKSGQGAVTNMCRGGRIFAPTTIWRKWHHKINKNQRKQAIMTAIACSGLTSIVMARGHKIDLVPEIPFVIESSIESLVRTKEGKKVLQINGIYEAVNQIKKKQTTRPGKGKFRNKRLKKNKGPLMIYENNLRCFRNISGIEICSIHALNLLKLAPGGHVGRFCIWTSNAFVKLDRIYVFFKSSFLFKEKSFLFNGKNSQSYSKNIRISDKP
jgi:large subunit ribosomal protein L4e